MVSTYSTNVPWSRDKSRLSIHIMWSISQSRDVQKRKLKTIKYSVRDSIKPADNACSWLFSLWVAAVTCYASSLIHIFGSPVCGWFPCLTVFWFCWQCWSLACQLVSGCHSLLCFKPADKTCPWISRKWVVFMPHYISSILTMSLYSPQNVSDHLPHCVLCLMITHSIGASPNTHISDVLACV